MTPTMKKVLLDFKREVENPRPNLQKVYLKWTGKNFDDFAMAVKRLYDDKYISIPKSDIATGGDDDVI